ncbi:MAG: peptidoglycan DD-metalloendopeptidase family protein [Oscillospiraceae bacterium]|jgi:murein DD-endopeptidase MepM/ murein hydrolase activator NlpD|nr:peptidoglycan DD-metalloendopeptidase family protein [Oscillospiraceae bacterium]
MRISAYLSAVCVAAVSVGLIMNSMICYAIYVGGEPVGTVSSIAEAGAVIDRAQRRLTEILGYEYAYTTTVSVTPDLGVATSAPEALEDAVLLNVGDVELLYALEVNGEAVGAAEDRETLATLLRGIRDAYATDETVSSRFLEQVSISRRYIGAGVTRDISEIKASLAPGGEYALTVRCLERTTASVPLPFEIEYYDDGEVYIGEGGVVSEGRSGVALVTTERVLHNNTLVSENEIEQTVLTAPVPERVAVGVRERPPTASYGEYVLPADGKITSFFGFRRTTIGSSNHQGIDISGKLGQEIWASDGGEVIYAGSKYSGYGQIVQVLHDNGDVTYYAHCSKLLVSEGERVARGQTIALMGRTGVASGVHCHFEIRVDGVPVDPLKLLSL